MYTEKKSPVCTAQALFLFAIGALLIIGIIFVYSSSSIYAYERLQDSGYFVKRHLFGIVLGLLGALLCNIMPPRFFKRIAPFCFLLALFLTALTLIPFFAHTMHGSSRWLRFGFCTFQPSELLKYAFIIYLAYFFEKKSNTPIHLRTYLQCLCILIATAGTLLLQPDFGMAVTLSITGIMLAFVAGIKTKHLVASILAVIPIALILIWLKPYRIKRILVFLNPWADPQGSGFQIIQSFIAIGSGSLWGVGIGQSKQKFFYLPMQHTDFIFSIIAEEAGFVGSCVIILLFILFLFAGLRLAFRQTKLFERYTICGCVILLSLQALINISVTTGLVPTKGIGLPFISYGNSSLASTIAMIGLLIKFAQTEKH
jgi:cell division protein FtsW